MTNVKYGHELFNQQVKDVFLSKYNEQSRDPIKTIFKKIYKHELRLNKDIYDFNLNEVKKLLKDLKFKTLPMARSTMSYLQTYVDWAIQNKYPNKDYNKDITNPFANIDKLKYSMSLIQNKYKEVFSNAQIETIEDKCINYQDKIIIRLLYEGASGKGHSELLNLSISDVDFNTNKITLINEAGMKRRTIEVSDRCLEMIEGAANETRYKKYEHKKSNYNYVDLIDNGMVIKLGNTQAKDSGIPDSHLILRRLNSLRKQFDIEQLTTKNILQSGMLTMAKKLIAQSENPTNLSRNIVYQVLLNFGKFYSSDNSSKVQPIVSNYYSILKMLLSQSD